jgi:hypothetical protein
LDERTRARHAAVHALLDQGVGLLERARRATAGRWSTRTGIICAAAWPTNPTRR